ncbi:MAG: hypothetical protein ABSD74_09740 [Rhizomicrobium sp.]
MRRIFVILAAAIMLAGCLPVTSTSPVGSTAGFKADPDLYGMWEGKPTDTAPEDADRVAFISILPGDEGNATAVFIDMPVPVKSGDWATYALTTAKLGIHRYINARATFADGHPADGPDAQNAFPLYYRIDPNGTLVLYLLDEDATRAAVKTGKIAGTVGRGDNGDVMLTAAPAELDAFFASKAGRALFIKPLLVMHRVK